MTVSNVLMTADAVGGVWRYAMDLGGALVSRGVRVTVAMMGPAPRASQVVDAERRGIGLRVGSYSLEWMDEPWKEVEQAGRWLLALDRAIAPDIVHLNGYSHAPLPWSAPCIVAAHSCVCSWWRAVRASPAPPEWHTYRKSVSDGLTSAAVVVAPTRVMLHDLEQEYGPCARAKIIPNGIDDDRVVPAVKEEAILTAGRLWDEAKNIDAVCAAAEELSWPVWIAGADCGPGGKRPNFGAARHLGVLPAEEMTQRYRRAAIYTLPARYEPFGLSVLEAARAGCALVLGDIPSLRENWDGAALFVQPDDHRGLARALRHLIEAPAERTAFANRAYARSRQFTVTRMATAYLETYGAVSTARSTAAQRRTVTW